MRTLVTILILMPLGVVNAATITSNTGGALELNEAVSLAVESDPWLQGSRFTQTALNDEATSAKTLPDPRVSLMANNFPLDSFDINQEAMTQLSVSITQMFPRGNSLALSQQQRHQLAGQQPFLRMDRRAKVTATVTRLWLEALKAQESIRLVEKNRIHFQQLVDAAEASYSSALGRVRQQDLIRAQVELTRLSDRLAVLRQEKKTAQSQLAEWVGDHATYPVSTESPTVSFSRPFSLQSIQDKNLQSQYELVRFHPALRALDQRVDARQTNVELAMQKYKPEWGLTAQYGYRGRDQMGRDRADMFSFGVTFDLPVFTGSRQDREVSAAVNRAEAIKTEKQLLARQLAANLSAASVQLAQLDKRQRLYSDQLLPQMAEHAEAALAAYRNDNGDFSEAVRARIAELDVKVEALVINIERQKVIAKINYLLAEALPDDERTAEPS